MFVTDLNFYKLTKYGECARFDLPVINLSNIDYIIKSDRFTDGYDIKFSDRSITITEESFNKIMNILKGD